MYRTKKIIRDGNKRKLTDSVGSGTGKNLFVTQDGRQPNRFPVSCLGLSGVCGEKRRARKIMQLRCVFVLCSQSEDNDGLFTRVTKTCLRWDCGIDEKKDSHASRGNMIMVTKTIPLLFAHCCLFPASSHPYFILSSVCFSSSQANAHVRQHRTLLSCNASFIYFVPLANPNGKDQKDEKEERKREMVECKDQAPASWLLGPLTPFVSLSRCTKKQKQKEKM